jgi:hypothetical protein
MTTETTEKPTEKKLRTLICAILDESGSMRPRSRT